MPRKRKVKGSGVVSDIVIAKAKAAARKHVLPLIKKHLAALEKKLGGQIRRQRRKPAKKRRKKARAGSSRIGGSSRL